MPPTCVSTCQNQQAADFASSGSIGKHRDTGCSATCQALVALAAVGWSYQQWQSWAQAVVAWDTALQANWKNGNTIESTRDAQPNVIPLDPQDDPVDVTEQLTQALALLALSLDVVDILNSVNSMHRGGHGTYNHPYNDRLDGDHKWNDVFTAGLNHVSSGRGKKFQDIIAGKNIRQIGIRSDTTQFRYGWKRNGPDDPWYFETNFEMRDAAKAGDKWQTNIHVDVEDPPLNFPPPK